MMPAPSRRSWADSPRAIAAWQLLLAALMLAVCVLAFDPNPPDSLDTGWDKLNHALAFTILTAVALLAAQRRPRPAVLAALAMLAFGAFIELVQTQIPGRSGEWPDLVADGAGIAAGLLALHTGRHWLTL